MPIALDSIFLELDQIIMSGDYASARHILIGHECMYVCVCVVHSSVVVVVVVVVVVTSRRLDFRVLSPGDSSKKGVAIFVSNQEKVL